MTCRSTLAIPLVGASVVSSSLVAHAGIPAHTWWHLLLPLTLIVSLSAIIHLSLYTASKHHLGTIIAVAIALCSIGGLSWSAMEMQEGRERQPCADPAIHTVHIAAQVVALLLALVFLSCT